MYGLSSSAPSVLRSPGTTSAAAQRNRAVRLLSGMSASCLSSSALLALSLPCSPAQRADRMPGALPMTSTIRPESSATAGQPVRSATSRALMSAFSWKVTPSSTGSGNPREPAETSSMSAASAPRRSSRMRRISASLPSLCVATMIFMPYGSFRRFPTYICLRCSMRAESPASDRQRPTFSACRAVDRLSRARARRVGRPAAPCCLFRRGRAGC